MKNIFFILLSVSILVCSCDDMKTIPTANDFPTTQGETGRLYVLSEGIFNMNNSALSCIDFVKRTITPGFFSLMNDRGLGDTANDMKQYGNYLWIVVNVSSQVEIVNINTGVSIRRIPLFNDEGLARQPRFIDFDGNKAYVCSFDGTVTRIDIQTLKIDGVTTCGRNPDGIAIANGKLYVSNSGGLDWPNYDNSVSVVDLNSFSEIKEITVGMNPSKIEADSEGDLYVVSRGNNGNIKASWSRIDSETDSVVQTFDSIPVLNFTIRNDIAYLYNYDYVSNNYSIKTFDCKTEQILSNHFISDSTALESPFGIYVHPFNGNVYLTDARSYIVQGSLYCFNQNGMLLYKIDNVGINPNTILIVP